LESKAGSWVNMRAGYCPSSSSHSFHNYSH
jgi:hypothetical protein